MNAFEAVVTRQTETHIFFTFAQDANSVEMFAARGVADLEAGTRIIVETFTPGLWFISDTTSLS